MTLHYHLLLSSGLCTCPLWSGPSVRAPELRWLGTYTQEWPAGPELLSRLACVYPLAPGPRFLARPLSFLMAMKANSSIMPYLRVPLYSSSGHGALACTQGQSLPVAQGQCGVEVT